MAHDIVRVADQFAFAKTAYFNKVGIDRHDHAFKIGFRNEYGAVFKQQLCIGDGQIDFHVLLSTAISIDICLIGSRA